jgi:hypothetical protein
MNVSSVGAETFTKRNLGNFKAFLEEVKEGALPR